MVSLGDGPTLPLGLEPGVTSVCGSRTETVADVLARLAIHRPGVGLHVVSGGGGNQPVVELVIPDRTTTAIIEAIVVALEGAGASPVACRDVAGRIVDRLLVTAWLESLRQGSPGDRWLPASDPRADLEVVRAALQADLGGDRFAGPGGGLPAAAADAAAADPTADPVALAVIAEAYRMVDEGVAGTDALEQAMTAGAGWPSGPFALAGAMGLRALVTDLVGLARTAPDPITADRFAMPSLLWAMATA